MAFCLPRSFNITGPRIRADKFHATPEMWELSAQQTRCYAGAIWGLLLGREMFPIKLSDLVESSHK